MKTLKPDYTKYLDQGAAFLAMIVNMFNLITGYDIMLSSSRKDLDKKIVFTPSHHQTDAKTTIYSWPNFNHLKSPA